MDENEMTELNEVELIGVAGGADALRDHRFLSNRIYL